MRPIALLALTAALLLAGCGPESWLVEREIGRTEGSRELAGTSPRVDPLLAGGDERRFAIEIEQVYEVSGARRIEVVRQERPFNVFYEVGETGLGILATPFYVLLFPVLYPVTNGLDADRASIGRYFAIIPERLLNPFRNDFFQEDIREEVVEERSDPFRDRVVEDAGSRPGGEVRILSLTARVRDDPSQRNPVEGARIEAGPTLVFAAPEVAVDEYTVRLSVDGEIHEIRFQDY